MRILLVVCVIYLLVNICFSDQRDSKQFSLFSVVQFPNDECISTSSSTTNGTCYTTSECGSRGGAASGTCAAGFGVCCVISTTTCGSTISTNTSYIRNPGYPSTYTPTSGGTCVFTINKVSDDICQLRLDFQTFSGFTVNTVAATRGACTDSFAAAGQTSVNPPTICGTNTGYHMYVEFGAAAADSITLTNTFADLTAKSWNILARQISCTAAWKAPTDCVQYFTGIADNVQSYNFGDHMLQSQYYQNCVRTAKGYCRIQWQANSATTPDTFQLDTDPTAAATVAHGAMTACAIAYVTIPNASPNGITGIPLTPATSTHSFQPTWCGVALSIDGTAIGQSFVSASQPFLLGTYTAGSAIGAAAGNGFSLDYTQLPC